MSRHDAALHRQLTDLARSARIAIVAGLPGTGKSLVVHELAHLALPLDREVALLRWDVVRLAFETTPAGRRHPVDAGVTQPIIRVAVGTWARAAVARWARESPETALLVGEAPLVGGRLVELVRPRDDDAESVLGATSTRFVVPVPSREVRAFLESERARRALAPQHARERDDAPPHVLGDLWQELATVAEALGVVDRTLDNPPYDPAVYRHVYERVLRHRHRDVVALDAVLPTTTMSPHEVASACTDLVPDAVTADAAVREAECRHADPAALARAVQRWWADAAHQPEIGAPRVSDAQPTAPTPAM